MISPINVAYARLLPKEKESLCKILEISERTMFNWLEKPTEIKSIYKKAIRDFLNEKLEKNLTIEDLFDKNPIKIKAKRQKNSFN